MASLTLNRLRAKRDIRVALWRLVPSVLLLVSPSVLWGAWRLSAQPIIVVVDSVQKNVQTHRHSLRAVLLDLDLHLHPNDRVSPSLDTPVRAVKTVRIARARPVHIVVDGRMVQTASWGRTPRAVLAEAGIVVDKYDGVFYEGEPIGLDERLDTAGPDVVPAQLFPEPAPRATHHLNWSARPAELLALGVVRAIPVEIDDGSLPFTIRTTAHTVGEALRQAEITIYLGDRVDPILGSEVVSGQRIVIQRSRPITIQIDGRSYRTRTRGQSVADALSELSIGLNGLDVVRPSLDTALYDSARIEVSRIRAEVEVEEEIAPFETVFVPDAALPIDTQQVVHPGAEGIIRTRVRVWSKTAPNGLPEIHRIAEDTWVAQAPMERLIAYGQRIEPRPFTAADGAPMMYWRKIRMYATSYSASTAGVAPDHPTYGRTYTGDPMRFGVVAVDPRLVPLRSRVFVPGYGYGDALDKGGVIRGRRIDLGYDDGNLVMWHQWVDVYLLWPPPPASEITWVLPNEPRPPS